VHEAPQASGRVELGTVVSAKVAGRDQRFLYASTELQGETDLRIFSPESPIGKVIDGLKIGEKASYEAPNGQQVEVEITNVETFES
jgi:transcription elongation factor GreA